MAELKTYDFCKFVNYDFSNDFSLYEMGTHNCPPSYSFGPVVRNHNIFHYVISGKGTLHLNNTIFPVHAGQGFLIPSNNLAFYQADTLDPWSYKWLHVDGPVAIELFKKAGLSVEQPIFTATHTQIIENIFNDLITNHDREYYCIGKVYELFDALTAHAETVMEYPVSSKLQYVKKIINYIQIKYCEPIHIDDIAHACGLNRSYLTRLFKEATGYTLQEYLLHYRMKKACKLLEQKTYSIQYVAYAVGYSDTFTFSKAFKRYTNYSPSEYKKN